MLVLIFVSHERLIHLNSALEKRIEGPGKSRVTEAVQHEPSRVLRYINVAGVGGAGDAILV